MSSLNAQQISSLLRQQGIPDAKIPTMTAIALAESGGRTEAYNPRGLDKSYGLFQVNMHGGLGPARRKEFGLKADQELFDPQTNVRAAKGILDSQGLGAWSVYKSGKYKDYLPQAQQALNSLSTQQANPSTSQSPQQISARTGGTVIILDGDQKDENDSNKFLSDFIFKNIANNQVTPKGLSIDPISMLTAAFNQTPNYLGS